MAPMQIASRHRITLDHKSSRLLKSFRPVLCPGGLQPSPPHVTPWSQAPRAAGLATLYENWGAVPKTAESARRVAPRSILCIVPRQVVGCQAPTRCLITTEPC